jgi:hypothetical protein
VEKFKWAGNEGFEFGKLVLIEKRWGKERSKGMEGLGR